ncbi:MAG: Maf family protein [Acidobacteriota bacterium]|nr:Maf family protein [Acidobacteriota bacterium]
MLILASASPRRHELLLAAGLPHIVRPSHIPEDRRENEGPTDFVRRISEEKARAITSDSADIVLAADTVVCLDEQIFGKPSDEADALRMLRALAGRSHLVHTGICLLRGSHCIVDLSSTEVFFSQLTHDELWEYTRSGEPADKAGAYAIQGLASRFVVSIKGSYGNVVGLPVSLVYRHLKAFSL